MADLTKISPSPPFENGETALTQVDRLLGYEEPADLYYIYTGPYVKFLIPGTSYGFCFNPFGHVAIAYRRASGEWVVMNINGRDPSGQIVNFHTPEEYLFSNQNASGGIFSRDIYLVRVPNVPPEQREKLHQYYLSIADKKFHIAWFWAYNLLRNIFPSVSEHGNCARWTLMGMKEAGLINTYTMLPRIGLIRLWEENEDTELIKLEKDPRSEYGFSKPGTPWQQAAPFTFFHSWFYGDLTRFSGAIVTPTRQEDGTWRLVPKLNPAVEERSFLRNQINQPSVYVPLSLGGSYLTYRSIRWGMRALFRR